MSLKFGSPASMLGLIGARPIRVRHSESAPPGTNTTFTILRMVHQENQIVNPNDIFIPVGHALVITQWSMMALNINSSQESNRIQLQVREMGESPRVIAYGGPLHAGGPAAGNIIAATVFGMPTISQVEQIGAAHIALFGQVNRSGVGSSDTIVDVNLSGFIVNLAGDAIVILTGP